MGIVRIKRPDEGYAAVRGCLAEGYCYHMISPFYPATLLRALSCIEINISAMFVRVRVDPKACQQGKRPQIELKFSSRAHWPSTLFIPGLGAFCAAYLLARRFDCGSQEAARYRRATAATEGPSRHCCGYRRWHPAARTGACSPTNATLFRMGLARMTGVTGTQSLRPGKRDVPPVRTI
jgi:hypothetical protein